MKELILVAGLTGVGKSTLARKIAQEKNGLVLDLDDFKKIVVDPKLVTEQIDPPQVRWSYYNLAINHALTLEAEVVVMDEVFHLADLRHKIEVICKDRDVEIQWIEVVCDYLVVKKRLSQKNRDGHILSSEQTLKMYLLFRQIFESFSNGKPNHVVINNND